MPRKDKNGVIHYNADSRSDYLSYISEFPPVGTPKVGDVLVFTYYFNKNPNFQKIPLNKKKFWTFQPIDLCFHVSQKHKTFSCVNLTQIPVTVRRQLIRYLSRTQPSAFSENQKTLKFRQIYALVKLFNRLKISIRKYRMERATEMKAVPPDEIEVLISFTANFYYASNYNSVIRRKP